MRTIKFRGKHLCGQWYFGNLIVREVDSPIPETKQAYRCVCIGDIEDGSEEEVEENTIGQFTGLYDKNGKEIYDGDIVKLYFPLSDEKDADLHEVRWNDKLGRYELVFICPFNGKENYLLFCDIANMTVVGNIYDNKELLTQTIKQ